MGKSKVTVGTKVVIGVGCQKSGTSSISNFLQANGLIFPGKKELHAFTVPGRPTLVSRTNYLNKLKVRTDGKIYGEYTPDYLIEPTSIWNLSQVVPDAKIIVSIRNPVDRAFSAYVHGVGAGALDQAKSFRTCIESALSGSNSWWENSLIFEGLYFNPIKRLFDLFPQENILVANYDDWTNPVQKGIFENELLNFCGLDRKSSQGIPHVNRSKRWRRKTEALSCSVDKDLRVQMQEYFDASKSSLEEFLSRDLHWWRR